MCSPMDRSLLSVRLSSHLRRSTMQPSSTLPFTNLLQNGWFFEDKRRKGIGMTAGSRYKKQSQESLFRRNPRPSLPSSPGGALLATHSRSPSGEKAKPLGRSSSVVASWRSWVVQYKEYFSTQAAKSGLSQARLKQYAQAKKVSTRSALEGSVKRAKTFAELKVAFGQADTSHAQESPMYSPSGTILPPKDACPGLHQSGRR